MSGVIAAAGITAAAAVGTTMMSKGGGGGGGATQQTEQQTKLPGWVEQGAQDIYGRATQIGYDLKDPYSGQRVADMTPEQRNLIGQLYGNAINGQGGWAYDRAQGVTNGLMGFNSGQITPQMMRGTNLQPYMSPYTSAIIDPSMKLMEQSRRQAIGQIGDQASQAHAFGGSRQGISEGVTNSQSALQQGQFGANLYNQNFLNAQQMATGDITRDLTAQQANMGARQYDAGFQANMARQMAGLQDSRQANFLSGITAAMGGQQVLQKQQQDQLAAAQQYYNEQRQQPLDQLAIWQNALSSSPYGKSSVSTSPGPTSDPWMTGLGTAATVGGLMGSFSKAGGFKAENYPDWLTGKNNSGNPDIYSYPKQYAF